MNWRQRKKVFLAALEVLEVSRQATACGMSRKLNELAEFVERGGKVQSGALFVTAARGSNHTWLDWAVDFLGCMPPSAEAKARIVAEYVSGDGSGRDSRRERRGFWRRVRDKGLDKEGLLIAGKMV